MKPVVYVDILILVNLLVNYFLLLTVRGFGYQWKEVSA